MDWLNTSSVLRSLLPAPSSRTVTPVQPEVLLSPAFTSTMLWAVLQPIIKNKLFAYGAYEHLKRATPAPVTPSAALTMMAAGVPSSDIQTAPQVQHAQWVDVRVDYTINQKNQAFVRYNYFRNNYPFNTAAGGSNALSAASDFQDRHTTSAHSC